MKRRNTSTPPMIGSSSLLVIFAVLCLTIFSLISLSTAQADDRLNNASISAVTDYYEADLKAEQIFSRLRENSLPGGVTVENNIYSYQCRISDTQVLEVQVEKNGENWTVLRWQAKTYK